MGEIFTGELPDTFCPPSFPRRLGVWVRGHNEEPSDGRGIPSLPLAPLPGGRWSSPAAGSCAAVVLPLVTTVDSLPLPVVLGAVVAGATCLLSIRYSLSATTVRLACKSEENGCLKRAYNIVAVVIHSNRASLS